jgi:hypothetical protein
MDEHTASRVIPLQPLGPRDWLPDVTGDASGDFVDLPSKSASRPIVAQSTLKHEAWG